MTKKIHESSRYSTLTWVVVSVLFLSIISVNTYLSRTTISELAALQNTISHSDNVLRILEETHVSLLTAESGQRGFLLTKDRVYLEHYEQAMQHITMLLSASTELISESSTQTSIINDLFTLIQQKTQQLAVNVQQVKRERLEDAILRIKSDQGRILYDEIHRLFALLKQNESNIRDRQIIQLQDVTYKSQRNLLISFVTSLILVIGVFLLAKLNIRNQQQRQLEMEAQNENLQRAVQERTRDISLFSDELARSNRELEDFAFVASHDLQEPLRKIMAFGDRIDSQSDNLSSKQRDYLKRMRGAADRMSTLISDLLEFSRINTRGKAFVKISLNQIVKNCIDDLNVLIEETQVEIHVENLPDIVADPTQMHQLFFNLLANAIKFSQKKDDSQVKLTVLPVAQPTNIEIENLSNWYAISVVDNGIGFEPEYAEKIFAPFQRLHSRESYKGTGIGLAICRRIVERHNGLIEAHSAGSKSENPRGATFTVTLAANNRLISIKR